MSDLRSMILRTLLSASALAAFTLAHAQPGAIDDSFGDEGVVLLNVTPANDFLSHAAVQSTGHVLLLSESRLYRVDEDGELDPGFGDAGVLDVTDFFAERVHVVEDDAIILVGAGGGDFHIRRYDADGVLDPTFGVGGTVSADFGLQEQVRGSYIASTGHILVLGRNIVSQNNDAVIARFTADGALDTAFGTDGAVIIDIAGSNDAAWDADETPDGDYIIGIDAYNNGSRYYMVKLSTTGEMDMTFGGTGMPSNYISNRPSYLRRVAVDPLGRIVGSGFYDNVQNYNWATVRRTASGSMDMSFANMGVRTEASTLRVDDLLMLGDGSFIVVGYGTGQQHDFLMIRYTTEGEPHPTFGDEGYVRTDGGNGQHDRAVTILEMPDGKLMLAGHSQVGTAWRLMLARYNGVDISTEVASNEASPLLRVFPVPTAGQLFVQGSEAVRWARLTDMQGRMVQELAPMAEGFALDLSGLAAGLYHLQTVTVGGAVEVHRVVRE